MVVKLDNKDLEQIDKQIQDIPFKFAYPLFLLFNRKIQEAQAEPEEKSKKADPEQ